MSNELKTIATIISDFTTKFGIPRQSGLSSALLSYIVFEPEYNIPEVIRGIEEYSHLWLIWGFSENANAGWHPTVRPPKLGGNKHVGVFASRSPFRPNSIGLSVVKLNGIEKIDNKITLKISGADLMNGTPIYDIKPYLPYSDCIKNAKGSFGEELSNTRLEVDFPQKLKSLFPSEKLDALIESLSLDPRPGYQNDPTRIYGFEFASKDIRFRVENNTLYVIDIIENK